MSQDSVHGSAGNWPEIAQAVETAARFRRLFPREGFEGLGPSELQVLLAVAAWPDLSHGELATCLALEKSSVSEPLRNLVSLGLVTAEALPTDRRSKVVSLSGAGEVLVSRYAETVRSRDGKKLPPLVPTLTAPADLLLGSGDLPPKGLTRKSGILRQQGGSNAPEVPTRSAPSGAPASWSRIEA
jgi:DNA-binding MarR family transcriptional regulator